jgi:integrase
MVERIPYARKQRQLPVILSADEVVRFLAVVPSLKHRTALMTAYAAGLRVSEVVRRAPAPRQLAQDLQNGHLAHPGL